MKNQNKTHHIPFSEAELVTILEAARIALADGDTFNHIAGELDIKNKELSKLRDGLEKYMNETP